MALSIRNPDVERLARKLADDTGYSLTETIEVALEAMDNSVVSSSSERYSRILAISNRCADLPDLDSRCDDDILGYGPAGTFVS